MSTQEQIKHLLTLKLTKFEFGFALGLQGHEPTPQQQQTLQRAINRHANLAREGIYDQQPPKNN
jgi:hypothetical protein